jgi:hypothetical protein
MEDVMPHYKVLLGRGWPILEGPDADIAFATGKVAKHGFGDIFTADDRSGEQRLFGASQTTEECEAALKKGYLERFFWHDVVKSDDGVGHSRCGELNADGELAVFTPIYEIDPETDCPKCLAARPVVKVTDSPIVADPSADERPFTKESKSATLKK